MINVNKGFNEELMRHCRPMAEHSEFVSRVRSYLKQGCSKEAAIRKGIDNCIRDGILAGILTEERDRVENILIRGLTEEEKERLYEIQRKREVEEARFEDIDRIVAGGLCDAEKACEILGVSPEDYKKHLQER